MEVLSDSVNSSNLYFPPPSPPTIESLPPDIEALRRLSSNLFSLFLSQLQAPNFTDLTITLPHSDRLISLHRCILTARSPFFHRFFAERLLLGEGSSERLNLGDILSGFEVGYEALVLVFGYLYSGKVGPLPREACECADEECGHVACWPVVDFMLQLLFASFSFEIWELVSLFQRRLLGLLGKVDIDDILMILSIANMCSKACSRLLTECIGIVVISDLDIVTLEKALPEEIVQQIKESRIFLGVNGTEGSAYPDKHVRNIYRALESDDIELVKRFLEEGRVTLDDACALHYAVAHCNPKLVMELLGLKCADVNCKNLRGYTVLHAAAKRKEPEIIVCLLDNGAQPYDLTLDGRKAIQISKRLTRLMDYGRPTEQCKASPKDRLCIEILERAEARYPPFKGASSCVATAGELLQKLLYLELRVSLAKLLYPEEARIAMANAHVDGTSEFKLGQKLHLAARNQGEAILHDEVIKEEHISRMEALSKTVETGMRYFPRCSEVISKLLDQDSLELSHLENNTTEVRRKRFLELQDEFMEAFIEDKKELGRSGLSPGSSSKTSGKSRTKSAKRR